jgi:hypothetical protein
MNILPELSGRILNSVHIDSHLILLIFFCTFVALLQYQYAAVFGIKQLRVALNSNFGDPISLNRVRSCEKDQRTEKLRECRNIRNENEIY